jgi:hypothetical protein
MCLWPWWARGSWEQGMRGCLSSLADPGSFHEGHKLPCASLCSSPHMYRPLLTYCTQPRPVLEWLINQILPRRLATALLTGCAPRAKPALGKCRLQWAMKMWAQRGAWSPLLPTRVFSEREKVQDDSSVWYLCIHVYKIPSALLVLIYHCPCLQSIKRA